MTSPLVDWLCFRLVALARQRSQLWRAFLMASPLSNVVFMVIIFGLSFL